MSGLPAISPTGLLTFLALAALLLALLRGLRHLQRWLRLSASRQARLERLQPVAELVVVVLYVIMASPMIFQVEPTLSPLLLGVLTLGLVGISWLAIRDYVDGVFMRAAGLCRPGDEVATGSVRGRVQSVGYRVVRVLTSDGEEAIVPWSRLTRDGLTRRGPSDACHRHIFQVDVPTGLGSGEATERVLQAALGHHFTSIAQAPEVHPTSDGRLAVTLHTLDMAHAPDVEARVRAALG